MIKDRIMKNKRAVLVSSIFAVILLGFTLNFNNIFISKTSKKVHFSIDNKEFTKKSLEIVDDKITLPYLNELDAKLPIGKTFDGYDTNNDGKVDYMPGDLVKVAPSFAGLDAAVVMSDDNSPFKAWLYDDNTYTKGAELKDTGDTISTPWDYNLQMRYLVIEPNFTKAEGGTIEITLPVGMQWYDGDDDINTTTWTGVGQNIENIEFTKLSGLSGSGGQGVNNYSNPRTGTLKYTYGRLAVREEPIVVPVTFDPIIWDGYEGDDSNLTGDFDAIKVTMRELGNTYTKSLKEISFSKALPKKLQTFYVPSTYGMDYEYSTYRTNPEEIGYYKDVKLIFEMPSNGENYADYIGQDPQNRLYYDWDIDTSDPTKVVYSITDIYMSAKPLIGQLIKLDSSKFKVGDKLQYDYSIEFTSYGGTKRINTVSKTATVIDNVSINVKYNAKYVSPIKVDDVEPLLGSTSIGNEGVSSSGKMKVEYLFNKNQEINSNYLVDDAIRAIKIAQVQNKNFDIEYILTDYSNNQVASDSINVTSPASNSDGKLLTIYELVNDYNNKNSNNENFVALDPEKTVIKYIKYEIDSIPAKTSLYSYGSAYLLSSSGNYYGKPITDKNADTLYTVTEYNTDTIKNTTSKSIRTFKVEGSDNSLSISPSFNLNSTSYYAGLDVDFMVPLYMHKYPYTSSQVSIKPNMYIVLPNGVKLDDSTFATRIGKKYIPVITSKKLTEGLNLYTLKFDLGKDYIGGPYYEDGILKSPATSEPLNVYLKFKTIPTLEYTALNLKSTIYVGENNANSIAAASQNIVEPFDFDGNGKLDLQVTRIEEDNKIISINPNTNQLKFTNELSINNREFTDSGTSKIISEADGKFIRGIATYRLNIENDTNGLVAGEEFYHYIPIIKKDVVYPNGVNNDNGIVDFKLTNKPVVYADNTDIYKYLYTTETSLVDANGNLKPSVEFKPIEEIENIEDITMIKITGNEDSLLMPYTKDIIELNLNYEVADDDAYNSGKIIKFSSYGWQKYLDGGVVNTENILESTDGVKVITRYLTEFRKTISDEYEFELPKYFEDKKIHILDVKENNLNLVDKESITSNQDLLDLNVTDNNFNIIATLNDESYDLSEFSEPELLYTVKKDSVNKIKFKLTKYNNILDSTSAKYVEVYLGDDLGIKYRLKLDIKRNSTYINKADDTIVSGSYYNILLGNGTNISLTSNSSYTAQFATSSVTGNEFFQLDSNFKKGTVIKMIDVSELKFSGDNYDFEPKYYYYKADVDKTYVLLSDFRSNENDSYYVNSSDDNKKFIFIVENNSLESGNYTIELNKNTSSQIVSQGILNYKIIDNKEFVLNDDGNEFEIKYNKMDVDIDILSSVNGIDTKYDNSLFALKVNFDTAIPAGAYIEMEDKVYLVKDLDYILNNENYFLIPLGNINDPKNVEYTLHAGTEAFEATTITHSLVLLNEPKGSPVSEIVNDITLKDFKDPAISIKLDKQLINNSALSDLNLNLKYIYYDYTTDFSVKLYVLEKKYNFYLRTRGLLNSVKVGQNTITPINDQAVFVLDDNSREIDLKLNLNKPLYFENGVYRIVLETNHLGIKNVQDVTNFIVIE